MKASYTWLCQLVEGLKTISPQKLAERLNLAGIEVESVEDLGRKYARLIVGEVLSKEKHPNADRLSLCTVTDGQEKFQVVCGAANVAAHKKYPFAPIGTIMPDGLEIKPIKLRGIDSHGMLCSAAELKLSSGTEGLMELPEDLSTGASFAEALGLNDVIFEIGITPNRGDILGHWGLAREVAALFNLSIDLTSVIPSGTLTSKPGQKKCSVRFLHKDVEKCRRFTLSEIKGLMPAQSPQWLKCRLENLGLRSINSVVDATNYTMLLTGHPVHAYDARGIARNTLTVETLNERTKFKTLDGVERELVSGDLVIGDGKGVVGLAGIMGGENSEIKPDTQDIILEVAFFCPDTIRKTSKSLGLHSDSAYRFSRFVNPETVMRAHEILQALIVHLCGGVPSEIVDYYPRPFSPREVLVPKDEIKRLLGIEVDSATVVSILIRLDCRVEVKQDQLVVTPPPARADLETSADIVEEVARFRGLDEIPFVLPEMNTRLSAESLTSCWARPIKDYFVHRGFTETVHYSFGDRELFEKILQEKGEDKWINLKNPLSQELAALRPSMLPHLLECCEKNHLHSEKGLRFFELRTVFSRGNLPKGGDDPVERLMLTGVYVGNPHGRNRFGLARHSDVFDGKGLLTELFSWGRLSCEERACATWPFHPGRAVEFYVGKSSLARLGELHPQLLQGFKFAHGQFAQGPCYFEIDFSSLAQNFQKKLPDFRPLSPQPPVYRDLALLCPQDLSFATLKEAILAQKPPYLEGIHVFDVYAGENIPHDMKSIAISMTYICRERSLTDEEVNAVHFKTVEGLKKALPVDLRSL